MTDMEDKTSEKPMTPVQEDKPINANERFIMVLINSVLYFFDFVLIILENKHFRLLVVNKNKKLIDKSFKTPGGARIFFKNFLKKKEIMPINEEWSQYYPADPKWLDKLLSLKQPEGGNRVDRKRIRRVQAVGRSNRKV